MRTSLTGLLGRSEPERRIVREYGRDSLLVWANLLLAPLMAALGLRLGVQSQEQLEARIEADAAAMRKRGSRRLGRSFSLPVIGTLRGANWYRVTFELASPNPVRDVVTPQGLFPMFASSSSGRLGVEAATEDLSQDVQERR